MSLDPASLETGEFRPGNLLESGEVATPPEFQFREMFQILRRRSLLIVGVTVLGLVAALLITVITKKMYSATATVEINPPIELGPTFNDLSGQGTLAASGGSDVLALELATQKAVIEGGSVALTVVEQLNLTASPPYSIPNDENTNRSPIARERGLPLSQAPLQQERVIQLFKQRLKVELVRDTRLLAITYSDPDPAVAARVSNAVMAAYTTQYMRSRNEASTQAFSGLTQQLEELRGQVFENERKVSEYERKTGLVAPSISPSIGGPSTAGAVVTSADTVSMARFEELNRQLTTTQVIRIARESIYRMTLKNDPDLVLGAANSQMATNAGPNSVLAPGSADLALLGSLREQRSRVAVQIAANKTKYGAKNPLLLDLQNEGAELDSQIHRELIRIADRARSDYDLAQANEKGLQERVTSQQQELTRVSSDANQLMVLEQEQLSSRALYQDVYTKLEEARIAAGLHTSNVTAVDPARVSSVPSKPKPVINLGLGLAVGFALAIFLAFLLDALDDSLGNSYEVYRSTGIPVLASVPVGESAVLGSVASAWLLRDPASPESQAVRHLRGGLLLGGRGERLHSVLFTGLSGGEGASTLCFNTAVALALQGREVLLIDADLQKPKQHDLTGVSNVVGLSDYLAGHVGLEQIVQASPNVNGLSILPSGKVASLTPELLGSPRFNDLFEQARKRYDFAVIDSSPLLSTADASLIANMVDRTALVIRSGKTQGELLQKAIKQLGFIGSRLRLVLTGVPTRSADFRSGDAK